MAWQISIARPSSIVTGHCHCHCHCQSCDVAMMMHLGPCPPRLSMDRQFVEITSMHVDGQTEGVWAGNRTFN